MTTPKTGAPELVESQADKEETANEAFRRIEAGASFYLVADKDLSSPPGSCADGAQYIVAATGSGAWAARTGEVAIAVGVDASNGWYFREPEEGVFAWVQDENLLYYRSAGDSPGTWAAYSASPGPITLDQLSDVDVSSSPTAVGGQVLTFNGSIWVPGAPAAGGATTLDGLTDVDTSSSPGPANGDVLTYNSALALWIPGTPRIQWEMEVACSDESTALTTGTNKVKFRMPCAVVLEEVRASLSTAQTSGGLLTVNINEAGATILSTKLIFDNTATTTVGSSPSAVISDSALADNAEISVDIDNIGDGTAKGLKVLLKGRRA